jgi:hypothetical protein
MADLFGRWVPSEWIQAVLDTVAASPQWNFLFLTKFPKRFAEFSFSDNCWVGTTVDCQARVTAAEEAFVGVKAKVKWLSIEPMLEPLTFKRLDLFQWVVIGGSSEQQSPPSPEWRVPLEWWLPLHLEAKRLGLEVYHKTNLFRRELSFPGRRDPAPDRAPREFDYLKAKTSDAVVLGEQA